MLVIHEIKVLYRFIYGALGVSDFRCSMRVSFYVPAAVVNDFICQRAMVTGPVKSSPFSNLRR